MSAGDIAKSGLDWIKPVRYVPGPHHRPASGQAGARSLRPRVAVLAGTARHWGAQVEEILLAARGYDISSDLRGATPPDLIIPIISQGQHPSHLLAELRRTAPEAALLPILAEAHLSGLLDWQLPPVTDFLVGPVREGELLTRVRCLLPLDASEEVCAVKSRLAESVGIARLVGTHPSFEKVKVQALRAAKSDLTVLVTGETGTGKELIAHAIHYESDRAPKPFIPVNCGAIPNELFENELFGHRREAFTDARSHQPGLIAEAEGGTLFLDEVDAPTPSAQIKLLRFLEDRTYRPLGASRPVRANVRLVAVTNGDLRQKVREGSFRADLYYRLGIVSLHLPPLRERGSDVVLLADHFLEKYGKSDERWEFSSDTLEILRTYAWPGNVRELENMVRQVITINSPKVVQPQDLPLPIQPTTLNEGNPSFRAARARAVSSFERSYLEELLQTHGGNVTRAAHAAQKDRRNFRRLLKKHGLDASLWRQPV